MALSSSIPTALELGAVAASPSALKVQSYCGGLEAIDRVANEWRELCSDAANDQPFYRPEWIRAYMRTFVPGARVHIIAARKDDRLSLVLPLIREDGTFCKVPVRKLRAPVNCHPGRYDAVRRTGTDGNSAIRATWEYLRNLEGWDLLQFRDTPEGSTVSTLAAEAAADGFRTIQLAERPNPYVPIPVDPKQLHHLPPNSKLRSQLRQIRRRMASQGPLHFYRIETADRDGLERFYQLEASGWKGRAGSAILRSGTRQYYDEIAEWTARCGYFRLYMLEWNGELLASHFSLTHRNRCYSPMVAYNENFKQFAPGHLIVQEILQDCHARGVTGYDITGQDQAWKMKWTSETRAVNHFYIFKGARGGMAHALATKLVPFVGRFIHKEKMSE